MASSAQGRHQERLLQRAGGGRLPAAGEVPRGDAAAAALVDRPARSSPGPISALQADDGLFDDRKVVASGEVKRGKLTYNSALMLRALLGLYRATGEKAVS